MRQLTNDLPSRRDAWDAIIIGGGIVGGAAAYYAARQGMRVLVIERDNIAAAQSGRNLGFVRQQGRDFRELELMSGAVQLWPGLEAELGRDLGWAQGGNLALAATEESLDAFAAWQARAVGFGLDTRILSRKKVQALVPQLEGPFLGATYTSSDGMADPARTTRAFHDAARALGAETVIGRQVDELLLAGGNVIGIRLGEHTLRGRAIVCAAGAGCKRLLAQAGIVFPQGLVRATVVRTERVPPTLGPCISGPTTGIRQSRDGSLHMSVAGGDYDVTPASLADLRWFRESLRANRGAIGINFLNLASFVLPDRSPPAVADLVRSRESPRPSLSRAKRALAEFGELIPGLRDLKVLAMWAGIIESTPDLVPAIGPVAKLGGLLVASGFSGHGFGPAPMAGKIVADLLAGRAAPSAIAKLSPDRFANAAWSAAPDMA